MLNALGAAGGLVIDQLCGEPPVRFHPVVWYGTAMGRLEQRIYADRRSNGMVFVSIGIGLGVGVGLVLRRLVGSTAATIVATGICAAGKMLDREALGVAQHLAADDLPAARLRLRSLVGRTADELDEAEISRAVIESVAENCVDAVTSSLVWAAVAGAPGVLAHRAINTLDAMVGHHNDRYEHFGWASARLDDAVNYLPARLTGVAVAFARPKAAREIARVVRRDAHQHPSPNGGIVEAAFAAALGVQLGGVNRYGMATEDRGTLGDGPRPHCRSVTAAVRLRRHATVATTVLVLAGTQLSARLWRHGRR
jgi:adenosylcobinamide-phosphate synthase